MSVKCTPLYIAKLGYAGLYLFFSISSPKHRLWALIKTASARARRFKCVPTIYVLSKNKKHIKIFQLKIFKFLKLENFCSVGCMSKCS